MYLTRKRIIAAAMDMTEREGVEAVTMHRLAADLGCGLVSLYSYIPSKSALLDGIAHAMVAGIERPAADRAGWREQLRAQALAFRQIARAHPRCAMMVASRPPSSAAMLRPLEQALATLHDAGFDGQDAVRIIRAVIAYVLGSVFSEIGVAPGLADVDDGAARRPRLRPAEFPHLTGLATEWIVSDAQAGFEFGLDLLLAAGRPH